MKYMCLDGFKVSYSDRKDLVKVCYNTDRNVRYDLITTTKFEGNVLLERGNNKIVVDFNSLGYDVTVEGYLVSIELSDMFHKIRDIVRRVASEKTGPRVYTSISLGGDEKIFDSEDEAIDYVNFLGLERAIILREVI